MSQVFKIQLVCPMGDVMDTIEIEPGTAVSPLDLMPAAKDGIEQTESMVECWECSKLIHTSAAVERDADFYCRDCSGH